MFVAVCQYTENPFDDNLPLKSVWTFVCVAQGHYGRHYAQSGRESRRQYVQSQWHGKQQSWPLPASVLQGGSEALQTQLLQLEQTWGRATHYESFSSFLTDPRHPIAVYRVSVIHIKPLINESPLWPHFKLIVEFRSHAWTLVLLVKGKCQISFTCYSSAGIVLAFISSFAFSWL